jgi:hypothetical protein
MAVVCFERIFMSRVFDRRSVALRALDIKILSKLLLAIAIDGVARRARVEG